jgi:hypothetical protein
MRIMTGLALLLTCTASWSPSSYGQQPAIYEAEYRAKAAGLSSTAVRKLEFLGEDRYLLSQSMTVRVLGAKLGEIRETSQFSYQDNILAPEIYRYAQSGISKRNEQVSFDWDRGIALSSEQDEQWQLAIARGIVDKLSFQLRLRQALAQGETTEVEIRMVDTDEVETHLYRVTGTEAVETELGLFDCLRVERIREPDSERRTTFWLARDWDLLLVKFEQSSGSGSETELLLEQAVLAGQEVTPLPRTGSP